MGKFTPGPWNFHEDLNPLCGPSTICEGFSTRSVTFAKGEKILGEVSMLQRKPGHEFGFPRVESEEELIANARLVLSAPDLHEALSKIEYLLDSIPVGRRLPLDYYLLQTARAALAKANGEVVSNG